MKTIRILTNWIIIDYNQIGSVSSVRVISQVKHQSKEIKVFDRFKMNLLIRVALLLVASQCFSHVFANNNLINKKVDRTIDLTTQLVKITTKLIVENPNGKPADEYYVVIENDHAPNLAYIAAYLTVKGHQHALNLKRINQHTYSIRLENGNEIKPNSQSDLITIEQIYSKLQQPFPETIKQNGRQLVKYNGNHYYFSLYDTRTQQTKIKLPATGSIESYSKVVKPVTQTDRAIHYGPFENVQKLAESPLQVHNENNSPFLVGKWVELVVGAIVD